MRLLKYLLYSNLIIGALNVLLLIEIVYQIKSRKACSKLQNYKTTGSSGRRIIGAESTNIEQFPYIAAILGKVDLQEDGYDFLCASVIVAASYALTANNCADTIAEYYKIRVRSGSTFWREKGTLHDVIKIYSNENFTEDNHSHDIAILFVKKKFIQQQVISVAGKNYQLPDNSVIQVAGWGEASIPRSGTFNSTFANRLYTVTLYTINAKSCENLVNEYLKKEDPDAAKFVLDNTQFCSGILKGGKDGCVYDSGGPAVHNNVLVGIISSGAPVCGTKGYPGIYANLRNLYGWLRKMSKKLKMQIKFVK